MQNWEELLHQAVKLRKPALAMYNTIQRDYGILDTFVIATLAFRARNDLSIHMSALGEQADRMPLRLASIRFMSIV